MSSVAVDGASANGQEVFRIDENVQIYYIGKDDVVSAPMTPSFLRIVVVNQG